MKALFRALVTGLGFSCQCVYISIDIQKEAHTYIHNYSESESVSSILVNSSKLLKQNSACLLSASGPVACRGFGGVRIRV